MESGHGNGNRMHLKTYPESTLGKGDSFAPGENADSPSSSSSSDTSLDDFFCENENQGTKSNTGTNDPPKLDEDFRFARKADEKDVSGDQSPKSGESSDHGSQSDTFPLEAVVISPDSSSDGLPVTQSPQIQVMGRSGEPDPYRIPSSVFARSKSTTPMEWSVASNESLFSIHVGNNSFSRDHIFLMGRSGELGLSGELMNFPNFPVCPTSDNLDSDRKSFTLGEDAKKSTGLGGDIGVTEAAAETVKEVMRAAAGDCNRQKIPPADGVHQSCSHSHRSDGSGASINSFAFPIKKRCAWPFSYCSWAFCYCCNRSWLFCYCCNSSRAFCQCCKCSRACCHCCKCSWACFHCCNRKQVNACSSVSPTLTAEGGRSSDSVMADSEQQSQKQQQSQPQPESQPQPQPQQQPQPQSQPQPQPQSPGLKPNAAGGSWFRCFSCCSFCC